MLHQTYYFFNSRKIIMLNVDYTKNNYHENRHAEFIENENLQFAWAECAKDFYFKHLHDGDEILEYGGGLGYNLLSINKNHVCHMLELSEIGRENAKKNGIITYADNDELKGKVFDTILCRHVLEHIDNPLETLILLKNCLKPKGKLILVLPIEPVLTPPVSNEIDFHLFNWNPRTICNLLKKAGFTEMSYRCQFSNGRKIFLPILELLGIKYYIAAVQLLGYLRRSRELVVVSI